MCDSVGILCTLLRVYQRAAHAAAHYAKEGHVYALELETQRVWDYVGDGYVHRLIQNRADGKLVDLGGDGRSGGGGGGGGRGGVDRRNRSGGGFGFTGVREEGEEKLDVEKVDAVGLEYSYMLSTQLVIVLDFYEFSNDLMMCIGITKGLV